MLRLVRYPLPTTSGFTCSQSQRTYGIFPWVQLKGSLQRVAKTWKGMGHEEPNPLGCCKILQVEYSRARARIGSPTML